MHDDLTAQDIEMMQKELEHRKLELMPELIEEVKSAHARSATWRKIWNTKPPSRRRTATAAAFDIWSA